MSSLNIQRFMTMLLRFVAIVFCTDTIITLLIWSHRAVTAKSSLLSQDHGHSHFKRIAGSDFVISGFKGVDISFGSGGASVANCASRKADANARLVTLWGKKHEDFMWCPSMSRYERVNGTFWWRQNQSVSRRNE